MRQKVRDEALRKYGEFVGQTFNHLTILRLLDFNDKGRLACECKCSCGRITQKLCARVVSGNTKTCGMCGFQSLRASECSQANLVGKVFGFLKVIRKTDDSIPGNGVRWLCECTRCGRMTESTTNILESGGKVTCGKCGYKEELTSLRHTKFQTQDEKDASFVLYGMRRRCNDPRNPHFARYGGRGITVCKEWEDDPTKFVKWAVDNGYKKGLTIERIDNSKGYCPENCKFIPKSEQSRNRDMNRYLEIDGIYATTAEWARTIGIQYEVLRRMSIEDATEFVTNRVHDIEAASKEGKMLFKFR